MYTAKLNFNTWIVTFAKNQYYPQNVCCQGKEICKFCKPLSHFFHKLQKRKHNFLFAAIIL